LASSSRGFLGSHFARAAAKSGQFLLATGIGGRQAELLEILVLPSFENAEVEMRPRRQPRAPHQANGLADFHVLAGVYEPARQVFWRQTPIEQGALKFFNMPVPSKDQANSTRRASLREEKSFAVGLFSGVDRQR
jgi:hypothetical protein